MKDAIDFKGYFKIESVDKDGVVIDEYEDDNLIMQSARTSMSEMFAKLGNNTFVDKLVLGSMGHVGTDVFTPRTAVEGFTNSRTRLFSESLGSPASPLTVNAIFPALNKNDVIYVSASGAVPAGYYQYLSATTSAYTLDASKILVVADWFYHGTVAPFNYPVTFDLPSTSIDLVNGDSVLNLVEPDVAALSSINVLQSGTSVTFNIEIAANAANTQFVTYSAITEAALYANGRIFSMKTFRNKLKDNTVTLRITWKITF